MKSIPDTVAPYNRTPVYDQDSVPDMWLGSHAIKQGLWAKIVVLEGKLLYIIREPREEICLDPDNFGVVEPRVAHMVRPLGKARFYLEFYR
ncbi:MAG: DUF1971 domain-containing protein [Gammaproteobacteria bacterium]|nr:DUF1971 domain-containing protein [Gammaproteobacteria bacterium]